MREHLLCLLLDDRIGYDQKIAHLCVNTIVQLTLRSRRQQAMKMVSLLAGKIVFE
jgi:hypothetical protein